ncbi:MAG: hypothetical protein GOMPHAMPRED_005147 [Gomphillus americanus]|uniref:Uncharacterized protein n=1 Tax=Gomphillus americanus TaxID=1940652 RepID=A0A8H3ERG3_9LECA|nr:MAG: hypothetical protein GOMPHAMPRED_005147 [Gomphillus americanus]
MVTGEKEVGESGVTDASKSGSQIRTHGKEGMADPTTEPSLVSPPFLTPRLIETETSALLECGSQSKGAIIRYFQRMTNLRAGPDISPSSQ